MTGDDVHDDQESEDVPALPPGALTELGEQLRVAATNRVELLSRVPGATDTWSIDHDPTVPDPLDAAPLEVVPGGARPTGSSAGAASPGRTRRRSTALIAMGIAAALVLVGALGFLSGRDSPPASAGVRVDRTGQTVTVQIDGEADLDEVVDALHDAGVVAEVEPQATGPSRIGRFTGLATDADQAPMEDITDGSVVSFESGDKVTIYIGVAAEDGQPYDAATDALATGEPFEGLDRVIGMSWEEARPILEQRAQERGVQLQQFGSGTTVAAVQMASPTRALVMT